MEATELKTRDYASHAGARRSGVVILCIHRDVSYDLRCPAIPVTCLSMLAGPRQEIHRADTQIWGTASTVAEARASRRYQQFASSRQAEPKGK
jgi:hypothetical protein